jgi:hypothetical protein
MLVYTRIYPCTYQHVPAYTNTTVHTFTIRYVLVYAGTCWYSPVCSGIYQHVLCFETLKFLWNPLVDTSRYKAVHCSMRTVPKYPVPLNETVQDGTRPYEGLVLPCTISFRGTGLFPTSIYCLVPWCIHLRISNKFQCLKVQYMLVHTSTY